VVLDVIFDESRNEEVAVIVALVHPQLKRHRLSSSFRFINCSLQIRWQQLFLQKLVGLALIDKDVQLRSFIAVHETRRVMCFPDSPICSTEISAERLRPPGALARIANGGEGRNRLVVTGLQCTDQSAVSRERL